MPKVIYIRDVDDEVAAALEAAATARNMSLNQFLQNEFTRLAREVGSRITLDLRWPQAPRLVWNGARLDALKLRGPDGAHATLNAHGSGSGQGMTQALLDAKRRAGEYIEKARVLGHEDIGIDIVALLEAAGWEVFPG